MTIHFFYSLMYLLLTIFLVWMYTLVPLVLLIILRMFKRYVGCFSRKKDESSESSLNLFDIQRYINYFRFEKVEQPYKILPLFKRYDRLIAITLLIFVILINVSLYSVQRKLWMGPQNANLQAKQYYVVGQVVYFYRRVISSVLWHPDAYSLIVPLTSLQKLIYNAGISQLPDGDSEDAVWAEQWFVYIYSRTLVVASGAFSDYGDLGENMLRAENGKILTRKEAKRGEVPLQPVDNEYFDLVWHCLETMATGEFADKEMYEHHYLRNYPGMAHYYAYRASRGYTKIFLGSQIYYAQMPLMTKRNEKLVNWLNELPDKWKKSEKTTSFINKHPKVEAMRQMALLMTLVNIFDARIWAREFDCADPYLKRLYEVREEFVQGTDGSNPAYKRMRDNKTASQFYKVAINSRIARFTNFISLKLCGKALAGEENMREFEGSSISVQDERKRILRNLFQEELKLLNMTEVLEEKYWTKTPNGYEYR